MQPRMARVDLFLHSAVGGPYLDDAHCVCGREKLVVCGECESENTRLMDYASFYELLGWVRKPRSASPPFGCLIGVLGEGEGGIGGVGVAQELDFAGVIADGVVFAAKIAGPGRACLTG